MNPILYHTTNWETLDATLHPGETGTAHWKTMQYGDLRIRRVTYSPGYKANHWCTLGHIVYCIKGEFESELSDGRSFRLTAGTSYQVSDNVSAHRSSSKHGAEVLIIDGNFLNNKKQFERNPWKM